MKKQPEKAKTNTPYAKIRRDTDDKKSHIVEDAYDESCFLEEGNNDVSSDWKKCPRWDVAYRQKVTPSDVYLQVLTIG